MNLKYLINLPNIKDNILLLALVIIILIVSIVLGNRSILIGLNIAFISIVFLGKRHGNKKMMAFALVVFFLSIIYSLLFKHDSTLGRTLVYKISFRIFKENWIWGIGLGNFKQQYLEYQELYFRHEKYSLKELLLADNTRWAFNDYWQFIIERGILGIVILGVALFLLFFSVKKLLSRGQGLLISSCILIHLTLTFASFFSHFFEMISFQISYIALSLLILYYAHFEGTVIRASHLSFLFLGYIVFLCINQLSMYKLTQREEEASALYRFGYVDEAINIYDELYDRNYVNPGFLINYSNALAGKNQSEKALIILNRLASLESNTRYYLQIAQQYMNLGDYFNAEIFLKKAIYSVPNRFVPRYYLYQCYKLAGDTLGAEKTADEIRNLPIKIPSRRILEILKNIN